MEGSLKGSGCWLKRLFGAVSIAKICKGVWGCHRGCFPRKVLRDDEIDGECIVALEILFPMALFV